MQSPTQRASDFAARLYSGVMTADDERELEAWLAEHPSHKTEYQAVLDTWYQMGDLGSDREVLAYGQKESANDSDWYWPKLAMAAGVFLAVAVGLFSIFDTEPELMRYATAVGEHKTVTLNDGTKLTLNTNTQVVIDFTDDYRRAIVDKGEAYFDVAKDAGRPFRVDVGSHSVTVLGTRFNVYKSSEQLEVAVSEGMVAVHQKENGWGANRVPPPEAVKQEFGQYLLEKGSIISYKNQANDEPTIQQDLEKVLQRSSWRTGFISFNNRPLSEVIGQINRYSRKKILIEDSNIMGLKVSTVVHLDDLESNLDGMAVAFPLKVTRHSDRIVLTGK